MPPTAPLQLELMYADEAIPLVEFVLSDDRPPTGDLRAAVPYLTLTMARAVLRWHEAGLDLLPRWLLMYGSDDAPTDAHALLARAREMLAGGDL